MPRLALALLTLLATASAFAIGPNDKQAFLKVNPLAGESKTTKTGGNKGLMSSSSLTSSQNTSKTITRNMKWNCEVSYRGKGIPDQVEVRVFYIGYEANDMKPKILGKDVKKLTLSDTGRASVELESPTVRLNKRRSSSGFSGHSNRGHIPKTKSTTSGQRMAGCVVQLWEDGELIKSYSSMSQWERAAKEKNFNDEVLNRKDKNRLN